MARIETDPNYTTPTFSRATAATDIFKKEDVQALAAAVSTHDHSSGKGLVLPPSAIPNGFITSAMIADGTIQSIDLADNAVTNIKIAPNAVTQAIGSQALGTFAASAASTTSATFVNVAAPSVVSITLAGGYALLVLAVGALGFSVASAVASVGIKADGAAPGMVQRLAPISAGAVVPFVLAGIYGGGVGVHTFQLAWSVTAGTLSMDAGTSMLLYGIEFVR